MALVKAAEPLSEDESRLRQELHRFCIAGDLGGVTRLLDAEPAHMNAPLDIEGCTALCLAVRSGHLRLTQELLLLRSDVNSLDTKRRTPLHIACMEEHADLALELITGKADANAQDEQKQTALHKAVQCGNKVEVLQVLMEHGSADPKIKDSGKSSPVLLAAEFGKPDLLAYLISQVPDLIHETNESLWSALHLAAHGREMRRNSMKPAKFLTSVKLLIEANMSLEVLDEDRKTPLHRAACTGNLETVTLLLESKADMMAADNCRWSPLHYACRDGHLEVAKTLIRANALVQKENPECLTPLAVATMENHVKMAELLMSFKADPNLKAKGLASPIMIARKDAATHADMLSLFELGFIGHKD